MALTAAAGIGAVAAVVVPWIAGQDDSMLGSALDGQLVRIPIGNGFELHWSWMVFAVVTLIAWAAIAAARTE